MIVVISDLHLTDGTSGETIREGAFRVFRQRLCDMVYDASWREGGKYKPVEEIHLILLGDILDVIRSTAWLKSKTPRPWDKNLHSDSLVKKIGVITGGILKKNQKSLGILRSLSKERAITLPPATAAGEVGKVGHDRTHADRVPVKVKMYYMVGNHDWFFHVTGAGYNQIRRKIVKAMGLENNPSLPFPHELGEVPELKDACEQHKLFVRHGDIYDPFNYEETRDASSLGDAIVIELLNRFPKAVEKQMRDILPKACLEGLREIDNVRPLLAIPVWVDGLLRRTCDDDNQKKGVKKIWNDLVDDFLKEDFVKKHDKWFKFDLVDELEAALKLTRVFSFRSVNRLVSFFKKAVPGLGEDTFYRHSLTEAAFKTRRADYIVYGHTHYPEIVPLDITFSGDRAVGQIYLNSGTWRRVHRLAQRNPEQEEFLGYYVMTYLAFYQGNERGGRPYESWSGSLAGAGSQI